MGTGTLLARQQEFLTQLLDDEHPLPRDWNTRHAAGMAVYRNAYRARLIDTLRDSYERTARWVGEDAFRRAATHHVITHPPRGWTLDDVGEGFHGTLQELFANDPEVAELAWLEWAMNRCFVSADAIALDVSGFSAAAAAFGEEDWARMRVRFLPGTYAKATEYDIGKLWRALGDEESEPSDYSASAAGHCIVWREGFKPVFMRVDALEGRTLAMLLAGASYGDACDTLVALLGEQEAVAQAGAMLGRWLHHGMIIDISK
ncbi:MAG: putative DNA-binding domain-containing protein [Congregibacter sp.]